MTTFDDRKDAFEKKFAHDAELKFKAGSRRNRLLGLWAAEKLGKSGDDATAYAKEVIAADFEEAGDEDVVPQGHQGPGRQRRHRTGDSRKDAGIARRRRGADQKPAADPGPADSRPLSSISAACPRLTSRAGCFFNRFPGPESCSCRPALASACLTPAGGRSVPRTDAETYRRLPVPEASGRRRNPIRCRYGPHADDIGHVFDVVGQQAGAVPFPAAPATACPPQRPRPAKIGARFAEIILKGPHRLLGLLLDEGGHERRHDDAAVGRQSLQQIVGRVARVIAQGERISNASTRSAPTRHRARHARISATRGCNRSARPAG